MSMVTNSSQTILVVRRAQYHALTIVRRSISSLGALGVLISAGLKNSALTDTSISHLWSLGFGTVTFESLIGLPYPRGFGGLLAMVLIANFPQFLLSCLFFTYNSLFTCLLLADEWNGYAYQRKTLRVSAPKGKQRSTYRLQLPYFYGIPLLTISGLLHWLASQSLFLARVMVYDPNGVANEKTSVSKCGYSLIAMIFVLIVGALAVLLGLANGFRKYKPGIPFTGNCSAAISAACHPPKTDKDASTKAVMWGYVEREIIEGTKKPVGHCTFTSFDVDTPVEGELYAGGKREKSNR